MSASAHAGVPAQGRDDATASILRRGRRRVEQAAVAGDMGAIGRHQIVIGPVADPCAATMPLSQDHVPLSPREEDSPPPALTRRPPRSRTTSFPAASGIASPRAASPPPAPHCRDQPSHGAARPSDELPSAPAARPALRSPEMVFSVSPTEPPALPACARAEELVAKLKQYKASIASPRGPTMLAYPRCHARSPLGRHAA